jgi:hypothetical protein
MFPSCVAGEQSMNRSLGDGYREATVYGTDSTAVQKHIYPSFTTALQYLLLLVVPVFVFSNKSWFFGQSWFFENHQKPPLGQDDDYVLDIPMRRTDEH